MEDKAKEGFEGLHKKKRRLAPQQIITPMVVTEERQVIPVAPHIRSIFWDDKLAATTKKKLVKKEFPRDFGAQLVRSQPPIVYLETFLNAATLESLLTLVKRRWDEAPPLLSPQETEQGKSSARRSN